MIDLENYVVGSRLVTAVEADDSNPQPLDILEAHRYPLQRHRAVSVWLFRRNDQFGGRVETLWQERSAAKPIGGGWWGNAICANVKPDEKYEACAVRRLQEEIGVAGAEIAPLYTFEYRAYGNETFGEHEIDRVFVGWFDDSFEANPAEAAEAEWVDWDALLEKNQVLIQGFPTVEESLLLEQTADLKSKTEAPVFELSSSQKGLFKTPVNPWTVMMLKDPRLLQWVR